MQSTQETIEVHGRTFRVISAKTPNDHRAEGNHAWACELEQNGVTLDVWMTKPRGRKVLGVSQFGDKWGRIVEMKNIGWDWSETEGA